MALVPPFDKIASTIYDFLCAIFKTSKYPAKLRIILLISSQKKTKAIGAELTLQYRL
jgi:hypothetical protein